MLSNVLTVLKGMPGVYGYNYEGQACMKLFEPYEIEGKKLLYAFPKKEQVVRAM